MWRDDAAQNGELSRSAFRVNERKVNKLCRADKKISPWVLETLFVENFAKLFHRRRGGWGKGAVTRDQSAPSEHIKRYTLWQEEWVFNNGDAFQQAEVSNAPGEPSANFENNWEIDDNRAQKRH